MADSNLTVDSDGKVRMSGLVSNLDIETIIEGLLKVEQYTKTRYETELTSLGETKDLWDEVKTKLETYLETLEYLNKFENWDKRSAVSTYEDVLTASASAGAIPSLYNFVVDQLAQAHTVASDGIDTIVGTTGNTADTDLSDAGVLTANSTFYVNGKAINVIISGAGENDTLNGIRNAINNTTFGTGDEVVASVINGTLVIASKNTGEAKPVRLVDDQTTRILESLGIFGQVTADQYTNALYHFDTGSGTTAVDSTSSAVNGTINANWTATAKYGAYALDFVRTSSHEVVIPSATENRLTSEMTLEAWVNPDAGMLVDGMGIISKGDMDAGQKSYSLEINADGTVSFRLSSDGVNWTSVTSAATVSAGSYSHIAGVLDGGVMKIYINGSADTNTQAFSGAVFDASTENVHVGRSNTAYFDGKIDEVRISPVGRKDFNMHNLLISQQDAEFTVNNIAVTRASNTNLTDVISNVTINLHGVGSSSLQVDNDTTTLKEKILEMVTSYNDLQAYLRSLSVVVSTGKATDQIISGKLQGDLLINDLLRQLRTDIGARVTRPAGQTASNVDYLGKLGIKTQGEAYTLYVEDEGQLDTMLATYFDDVEYLFRGSSSSLVTKMKADVERLTMTGEGSIDKKKETLNTKITDIENRIVFEESRLERLENSLRTQFSNMESAILDMNSQLTEMLQKLGSSTSSS